MEKRTAKELMTIAVSMIAILVLVVVGLVSCSGTGKTNTENSASASNDTIAETTTTKAATLESANSENSVTTESFEGKTLVLSGSTTLLEVANAWAEDFMSEFGGEITVNGGGSGVGIADLINGANDIGNSSRKIKDEEVQQAKTAGVDIREYEVLYDGIAIIVSKNIDVKELTINQLSDIYTGKVTNWSQVGGPDEDIVSVARDSASGTGEYFLERVVTLDKTVKDNDYSENCLRLQSNADIVNQVSGNENCIGYIGLGYVKGAAGNTNIVGVIAENSDEAVVASVETVKDGTYLISRSLYMYANSKKISELASAFIDFVLSDKGQQIGQDAGFVSIKK
jgi:phosphate transport system substrate-binding protein